MKKKKKENSPKVTKAKVRVKKTQADGELVALKQQLKIEASLDRVRKKALSMKKPDDLLNICKTLYMELQLLGFDDLRNSMINIHNDDNESFLNYDYAKAGPSITCFTYHIHPVIDNLVRQMKKSRTAFSEQVLLGRKLEEFKAFRKSHGEKTDAKLKNAKALYYYFYSIGTGALGISNLAPLAQDQLKILKRFRNVFDLAYQRYADIQKAEAQAREAQIEAALEKVRSRSLAMHHSNELEQVVASLFDRLVELGLSFDGALIFTFEKEKRNIQLWIATTHLSAPVKIDLPYDEDIKNNAIIKDLWNAIEKGEHIFNRSYSGETKNDYFRYVAKYNESKIPESVRKIQMETDSWTAYFAAEKNSMIGFDSWSGHNITREDFQTLIRFARVFEQAYTRFLDLHKAEAQTREAKIEASLERVRGKAMAMHSSEDLAATIGIFYRELESFSITPRRCGVGLLDKETRVAELSTMNTTDKGDSIEIVGKIKMQGHPVLKGVFDNWILQQEYHPVLRGNEIKEYYQLLRPQIAFPEYQNDAVQYGYFFFFPEGGVYAWTEKELTEDELKIYRKFTSVLSLTYKRYKDLKDAEIREKEAVKQATLDRVRAEIASMRTRQDLDRITPLIWNELIILGIPFIRCGVFIMNDSQKLIHTFLSTPDGKAIAAFHLPYDTPGNIGKVLSHWVNKENYVDHWDETTFTEFADTLVKQGALASPEQYLKTIPHGGFYLHFLPFLQGMLYVGNSTQLADEEIKLIQSVADAFSTAYARYEDFTKLEAAKQQVDKTLVDLKQAQQQLIQSEKMASLGELTAGIAHEIQNPLNFVNNFSDVSNELLDEMVEEVAKGNYDEAKAIADDVKQNLEKISHHGKRADGIVKGMLQHSRTSSGIKEPTDINALCDEYLRLSYHGLRAKDKSFNAKFETDFDSTLGKINVIPQDIGRVILNLINNAFYAVTEKKKKLAHENYEPTVTVTTKKSNGKVLISIKDNGNGIPDSVRDKIFQPFFTTKPTGQGTGLGLSLSYDIVTKAHSGELKVQSIESDGTELIIILPI